MNTVYGIFKYKLVHGKAPVDGPLLIELDATKDLAIETLRAWAEAIRKGEWTNTRIVKWHDEDATEVTWLKIVQNGEEIDFAVEELNVRERA